MVVTSFPSESKPIPGLAGRYRATADGRIWSCITGKHLKAAMHRDGYLYVIVRLENRSLNRAVHRLVCAAWHGAPPSSLHEANHRDLGKRNNMPSNLEWLTPAENTKHAWQNLPAETIAWMRLRRSFGAKKMNRQKRKLSTADVLLARSLVVCGLSMTKTAARLGVCRETVRKLIRGVTYRD